jgi:hypothetical protein
MGANLLGNIETAKYVHIHTFLCTHSFLRGERLSMKTLIIYSDTLQKLGPLLVTHIHRSHT